MSTHEVKNQVPPLVGYNLFTGDVVLAEALQREHAGWAADAAEKLGAILGGEDAIGWGFDANSNPPMLHTHNSQGQRIDEVRFHPAWYALDGPVGHARPAQSAVERKAIWRRTSPGRRCFFWPRRTSRVTVARSR